MWRILVVEDSASMRSFVRNALESDARSSAGVDVVEASSGFEALRLLPRGPYDLVITDINMPDINGLELIRFVRQSAHHRQIAVLIISTQSAERDKKRGLALGADGFLAKPFSPEALREAVAQSLAGRGSAPPPGATDAGAPPGGGGG
jgi:two-component system chemotaxis response regulator CheY